MLKIHWDLVRDDNEWDWEAQSYRDELDVDLDWDLVRAHPDKGWSWYALSYRGDLHWDLVRAYPGKDWSWYELSSRDDLDWDLVRALHHWDWSWKKLSSRDDLDWDLVRAHPDKDWDWSYVCRHPRLDNATTVWARALSALRNEGWDWGVTFRRLLAARKVQRAVRLWLYEPGRGPLYREALRDFNATAAIPATAATAATRSREEAGEAGEAGEARPTSRPRLSVV